MRFLTQFAAFALAGFVVIFGLQRGLGTAVVHPLSPWVFGYFLGLTLLTYWITAVAVGRDKSNFQVAYLGGMVLRLLLSLGFVLVYFFRGGAREGTGIWAFLGAFFVGYFACAAFEIWAVLSNLRPFSEKQVTEK